MKRERKLMVEEFSTIYFLIHSISQILSAIGNLIELLILKQRNDIPELHIIKEKYYEAIEVFIALRNSLEILRNILRIPNRLSFEAGEKFSLKKERKRESSC